jgi:nicotinamide mononucleotide transporter
MAIDTPLSLLGLSTTPLELISFVLAMLTVWLNIRQNHWAWLFSIVSSVLYAAVFVDSRLYGDAGLQFVFVAVSLWGWYQWLRGGDAHQPLQVSALSRRGWQVMLLCWLLGFLLLSYFLRRFTDTDVPHMDGFLTAGSLVGQFLLSRKKLENWLVWIAVDVLYVGLYIYKQLHLTALLYALFVLMAMQGWRQWRKSAAASLPA